MKIIRINLMNGRKRRSKGGECERENEIFCQKWYFLTEKMQIAHMAYILHELQENVLSALLNNF